VIDPDGMNGGPKNGAPPLLGEAGGSGDGDLEALERERHRQGAEPPWAAEEPEEAPGEALDDWVPPDPGPWTPRGILAALAIVLGAGLERLIDLLRGPEAGVRALGASGEHLAEWWRLVLAGFMHFSPAHHFSNAVLGFGMGVLIFGSHGIGAACLTWLLASVAGIGAELAASSPATLVAGASAANYGLVGLWAKGQLDRAEHTLLPRRERLRTLGLLLLLIPGAFTPVTESGARVAVLAHAVGFVTGFLGGYLFKRRVDPARDAALHHRSQIGLWTAAPVVVAALVAAVVNGAFG
jgi:membrane associated rhomboid family serine protease